MKSIIFMKVFIVIGLVAAFALPEYGKELFVHETGKFGHPDSIAIFLLAIGLYLNWKHIRQIIIVICALMLIHTTIIMIISSLKEKPVLIIYSVILIITILLVRKLNKLDSLR